MVQVTVHDVVDVLAVRDRSMTAAVTVTMRPGVCAAFVPWCAGVRILLIHCDGVLVEVVAVDVMKVPVVQVVAVTVMLDDLVAAAFLVLVLVFLVNAVRTHDDSLAVRRKALRPPQRGTSKLAFATRQPPS
jgi:hypothetical protein